MGGTSLDGIKFAVDSTDGLDVYNVKSASQILYPEFLQQKIRSVLGKKITNPEDKALIDEVEALFTDFLINSISEIIREQDEPIDVISLEGPTICHDGEDKYTYQLGKGRTIAEKLGIKLVTHFRNADILNGGQGSPITATYYSALSQNLEKPTVFINIGGNTFP